MTFVKKPDSGESESFHFLKRTWVFFLVLVVLFFLKREAGEER